MGWLEVRFQSHTILHVQYMLMISCIYQSSLGYHLIDEMNRIGMLVDLSHTSDNTARQALKYSKAPVIWSHSSARAVHSHERNVPDEILQLIGTEEGQDAVVMVRSSL